MDRINITVLNDKYFSLLEKQKALETNLKTTTVPRKVQTELDKLDYLVPFDIYIIDGLQAVLRIQAETDEQHKKFLYQKYIETYYPHMNGKFNFGWMQVEEVDYCKGCASENVKIDRVNCIKTCVDCGGCEEYIITRHTWDVEQLHSHSKQSYDKIKTMMEWIDLFLGRETKDFDMEIIDKVKHKLRRVQIQDITIEMIYKKLKELQLNNKYKFVYFIFAKITNIYPTIEKEAEQLIYEYFAKIQDSFNRLKSQKVLIRKNIWVYRYCVYKICELIEKQHTDPEIIKDISYLKSFIPTPLVCSHKTLFKYDQGWKLVMNDLGLPYIETI